MDEEVWAEIPNFSSYLISNYGNVFNKHRDRLMSTSPNNYGYMKISLYGDDGIRHTIIVATLVGEAFVKAPDRRCDHVMVLDGNLANVAYWNLAWRPLGFAWKYYRQLRTPQTIYYQNLPVRDLTHSKEYDSIIEAGMALGMLFDDIWRSTYTGDPIYPYHSVFRVLNRSIR